MVLSSAKLEAVDERQNVRNRCTVRISCYLVLVVDIFSFVNLMGGTGFGELSSKFAILAISVWQYDR